MKDIDKRKGVHKILINLPQEGACYVVVKEARYIPLVNALVDRMTPEQLQHTVIAVSYTHLTLPTICSV